MKTWKKLTIFSISCFAFLFIGIIIDLACAEEADPYDYYISFFHNNLQGEKNYGSFYLSDQYVFDDTEPVDEADINAKEWVNYLGGNIKAADVKKAMYQLSDKDDSVMVAQNMLMNGNLPDSLKGNTFLRALTSGNNSAALQYYAFAKRVEHNANSTYSRWDPTPVDTTALHKGGTEALEKANGAKDKFLKLRYLYQAQRLLHYGGEFKPAMAIYDEHISNLHSDSYIKGRALSLKAGEIRRLGDSVKAAFIFSKIFAEYPERRVQAYRDYNFCNASADSVAKLASNKTEKAFVYAISSLSNSDYNLSALEQVYKYDPQSELVGVLLVREINKLEESYMSHKLAGGVSYNYDYYHDTSQDKQDLKSIAAAKQLQVFCNRLSQERKYTEPGLGYMASAYLAWMGGNNVEGLALLHKLDGQKLSTKLNDQRQLVNLLLMAQQIQKFDDINEAQLLPSLQWLDKKVDEQVKVIAKRPNDYNLSKYDFSKFATSARDFYQYILAPAYIKQHDTVKAALCILKSENILDARQYAYYYIGYSNISTNSIPVFWEQFVNSKHTAQIIGWKKNPSASPYLKFYTAILKNASYDDLYDLLGTTYLREHNYAAAVKALKQIKIETRDTTGELADPFISQLPDYPKTSSHTGSVLYTKLTFAQAMLSLQNKLKSDPKNAATYYYKLATGLYNASTYGNAYYLISYDWSAYDYGRTKHYSYDDDYIQCKGAEAYYLKARSASTNPEFKARCTFMAAKCRQKQYVYSEFEMNDSQLSEYNAAVRRNPYFAELNKSYRNTRLFKAAVSDCSYLRDFLKENRKGK